jgi:hypothetical protein
LACYCAQLNRFDESQHWFKKEILIDHKMVPKLGIDDPDLKPLWDGMSTTIWKKADRSTAVPKRAESIVLSDLAMIPLNPILFGNT